MSTVSPQIRKAAQQGVCAILRGSDFLFSDNALTHHPAAVSTAKFCIKEMEHAGGETMLFRGRFVVIPVLEDFLRFCGGPASCSWYALFSVPRQQRGHHHASCAGSSQGVDGDVSSGSCQVMLRDSAASDDTQPRGENM